MIWFFPEGEAPITWTNVRNAVAHARQTNVARIGYFSSVPYILQMLSDETAGLELLESMDLVGVGGAALPEVTGDNLVRHGVHLLSRMGSAECGFLMSSHRDYPNDKDWQFLRPVRDASLLAFEPRDDGLLELVVKPKWPHLAKINRKDGSYATSDLFEPHPQESGLWRYHSRADAQITLSNGKKFDPSPLEASILASTSLLTDVLIFGNGRGHPGLLLLPCVQESPQDVVKSIWPIVESLNAGSQNHARIAKSMLVVAEPAGQPGLEKSSKGTVLRRQAEARFAEDIERAYSQPKAGVVLSDTASYDELRSIVINCFTQVLGRAVNISRDLYGQGVDSISCIQIRGMIQNSCLPVDSGALPLNVLYDKGTVDSLVSYLWHLRQDSSSGNTPNDVDLNEAQNLQTMTDLAAEYTRTLLWSSLPDMTSGETVVLTGSTGFLGSHILRLLLMDNQVKQVICLIRGSSAAEVQNRLEATLRHRGCSDLLDQRVLCAPCNLSREDLGLTTELRSLLAAKAALYIHSAWTVNFSLHISSFEDQIRGTANMLKLAAQSGAQMVFISSTAAVSHARHSGTIHEIISTDPKDASPLGYSQSKWVAEQICAAAADRQGPSGSSTPRCPILIVRVGQLCGDERGVWNESEAYPLMLSTARITGSLPAIEGEVANWMPVHLAARAVIDIALQSGENGSLRQSNIFHVLNHHNTPSWEQMLRWLQEDNNSNVSGASFELQPASRWVSALEAAAQKGGKQHPAYALLGLWKNAFESAGSFSDDPVVLPRCFDTARSQQVSPVMRSLQPLDREQLVRMWRWVNHTLP
jgi:thioester reductase-like protein